MYKQKHSADDDKWWWQFLCLYIQFYLKAKHSLKLISTHWESRTVTHLKSISHIYLGWIMGLWFMRNSTKEIANWIHFNDNFKKNYSGKMAVAAYFMYV